MESSVNLELDESTTVLLDQPSNSQKISTVNGCIVYTRLKRSLTSRDGFCQDVDCKRFRESSVLPLKSENRVDCCNGISDGGECGDELKSEPREVMLRNFKRITRSAMKAKVDSGEETVTVSEQQGTSGKVPVGNFKRFTRSAMKANVESGAETVNELEQHGAAIASSEGNGKVPRNFKKITRSAMKVKVESGEETVTELEQQGAAVASGKGFKRITRSAKKANVESGEETVTELEHHGASVANSEGDGVVKTFKRITRSTAMKTNAESGEEMVTELEQEGAVVASDINGALAAPRNKLEMKMSKKIVVNKKPTTVKELFRTGLLDDVSVVYMGGIKKVRFDVLRII